MIDLPSPNHDARPGLVDMLVLHYTGMRTGQEAIDRLRDPIARVSSHYVVEEDGRVFRLVPEERRAWHAGVSSWQGQSSLNDLSVGIEIVNPGHEWGYRAFPPAQMASVVSLSRDIVARHKIPADRVVAHSDIAPARKQDPGELFDWRGLSEAGIGLWPKVSTSDTPPDPALAGRAQALLTAFGYECPRSGALDETTQVVLRAFQRRFRPGRIDGLPDPTCIILLENLVSLAGRAPG